MKGPGSEFSNPPGRPALQTKADPPRERVHRPGLRSTVNEFAGGPNKQPDVGARGSMHCNFDECRKVARKAGLCWGHHWQKRFADCLTPLRPYGLSAGEHLRRAALRRAAAEYAEADDDAEFCRADHLLRKYAVAYADELALRRRKRAPSQIYTEQLSIPF